MQQIRLSLHRWLKSVMEERDWTAAAWAKRADVTATNLTRFLKDPGTASMPSAETIGKLAFAAGSEPRFLSTNTPLSPACRVPVLSHEQIRKVMALSRSAAQDYVSAALLGGTQRSAGPADIAPRLRASDQFAAHERRRAAAARSDRDRADRSGAARKGDMVITVDGTSLCAYRYYHPQLVPISTDPDCCPMVADGAEVVGVAILVVRPLRAEAAL